jgi:hypothetical protein
MMAGYDSSPDLSVTVTNTGNQSTGDLTVTFSGPDSWAFTTSLTKIPGISKGETSVFTIRPNPRLDPGTYITVVMVSDENNNISESLDLSFTVSAFGIALSQKGIYAFSPVNEGPYTPPSLTVSIANTGTQNTGVLNVGLSGKGSSAFACLPVSLPGIPAPGTGISTSTFTVGPKGNLPPGVYTATVTVAGANSINKDFNVNFTVVSMNNTISGTVFTNDPPGILSGALVQLKQGNSSMGYDTTNINGSYTITGVPAGNYYYLEVSKAGYEAGFIPPFNVAGNVSGKNLTLSRLSLGISGTPKRGMTLTAITSLSGTTSYQWRRNGTNIATGPTYTVTALDEGSNITVVANRPGSSPSEVESPGVTIIPYSLGDTGPRGGKIFYNIDAGGWKYLEAALGDNSPTGGAPWGLDGTNVTTTNNGIGEGPANTQSMISAGAAAGSAARIFASDWFLPSKDELNQLYVNRAAVGISSGVYWSSSQDDADNAYTQDFSDGTQASASKNALHSVRAVRRF